MRHTAPTIRWACSHTQRGSARSRQPAHRHAHAGEVDVRGYIERLRGTSFRVRRVPNEAPPRRVRRSCAAPPRAPGRLQPRHRRNGAASLLAAGQSHSWHMQSSATPRECQPRVPPARSLRTWRWDWHRDARRAGDEHNETRPLWYSRPPAFRDRQTGHWYKANQDQGGSPQHTSRVARSRMYPAARAVYGYAHAAPSETHGYAYSQSPATAPRRVRDR